MPPICAFFFIYKRQQWKSGKAGSAAAAERLRLRLRRCVSELWFVVLVVALAVLPAATSAAASDRSSPSPSPAGDVIQPSEKITPQPVHHFPLENACLSDFFFCVLGVFFIFFRVVKNGEWVCFGFPSVFLFTFSFFFWFSFFFSLPLRHSHKIVFWLGGHALAGFPPFSTHFSDCQLFFGPCALLHLGRIPGSLDCLGHMSWIFQRSFVLLVCTYVHIFPQFSLTWPLSIYLRTMDFWQERSVTILNGLSFGPATISQGKMEEAKIGGGKYAAVRSALKS